MQGVRSFFNNTFRLYGQMFVEQNSKTDLLTKFFRGFSPIVVLTFFYTSSRDQLSENDPSLLLYYDLEIDRQRTPNFSEQKLKQWENYSVWKQRKKRDKVSVIPPQV